MWTNEGDVVICAGVFVNAKAWQKRAAHGWSCSRELCSMLRGICGATLQASAAGRFNE